MRTRPSCFGWIVIRPAANQRQPVYIRPLSSAHSRPVRAAPIPLCLASQTGGASTRMCALTPSTHKCIIDVRDRAANIIGHARTCPSKMTVRIWITHVRFIIRGLYCSTHRADWRSRSNLGRATHQANDMYGAYAFTWCVCVFLVRVFFLHFLSVFVSLFRPPTIVCAVPIPLCLTLN